MFLAVVGMDTAKLLSLIIMIMKKNIKMRKLKIKEKKRKS